MEPITTTGAAAIIVAIKAWCVAHGVSIGLPLMMKIATAFQVYQRQRMWMVYRLSYI